MTTGKVVVTETTKKVIRAIEPNDIIHAFLQTKSIDEPLEYVKRVCSESSANYPIYYFLHHANITLTGAIAEIKETTSRGAAKSKLISRIEGTTVPVLNLPQTHTEAGKKKAFYREQWINESSTILENPETDIKYCVEAIFYLTNTEITEHSSFIKLTLLKIYEHHYEKSSATLASNIRKAICRVDEALYLKETTK